MAINTTIKISKDFINFIIICFSNADFEHQHDQYDIGLYPIEAINEAFQKFISKEWIFSYNCTDCSFPKFHNIKTNENEACPLCGD